MGHDVRSAVASPELILVSSKTFRRNRHLESAIVGALAKLLAAGGTLSEGQVVFLQRPES
ncbi:MAG TPA: hypothetical protein VGM14_15905 [Streptosporangiaceae bacterium]